MKLIHRLEDELGDHKHDETDESESESQQVEQIEQHSQPGQEETGWRRRLNGLQAFWQKASNDWIFNLSSMLAYNFLTSIFPMLLFLIAVGGFVLGLASPTSQANLTKAVAGFFPTGIGTTIVTATLGSLTRTSGLAVVILLATSLWSGSQLFVNISSAFNIIFRLRSRDPLHQYIMAVGMMLIYTLLVPVVFLASTLSSAAVRLIFGTSDAGFAGFLIQAIALGIAFLVSAALFGAIYVVVPNKPVRWRNVWKGTLVASGLLVLYELLFPLYENYLLKPGNYGSLAGFAVVILAFFYYLGFILLLGAEVNSWELGQRGMASDIAGLIHSVQAYDTTRGAAGPTAGMPTEDLQTHQGRKAMENNTAAIYHERVQEKRKGNQEPPKFSEATTSNPDTTAEAAEHTTGYNENRPQHQPSPGTNESQEANAAASSRQGSAQQPSNMQSGQSTGRQQSHAQASADGRGDHQPASESGSQRGRHAGRGERHERRYAAMASSAAEDGRARGIGPAHPDYAAPLPPEARDLPHSGPERPRKNTAAQVITILATAALPVVMWLLGRNRRPA